MGTILDIAIHILKEYDMHIEMAEASSEHLSCPKGRLCVMRKYMLKQLAALIHRKLLQCARIGHYKFTTGYILAVTNQMQSCVMSSS